MIKKCRRLVGTYGALPWLYLYCLIPLYIDMRTRIGIGLAHPQNTLLASFLFFFPVFIWPRRIRLWTIVVFMLLYIPAGFRILHYITFRTHIDEGGWLAIFDTHLTEATGFIGGYTTPLAVLTLISFLAVFTLTIRVKNVEETPHFKTLSQVAFILMLVGLQKTATSDERYRPAAFEVKAAYKKYRDMDVSRNRKFTPFEGLSKAYLGRQTYVFVIGESDAREHHSIYGYARPTNPKLDEIAKELAVYKNVATPFPLTFKALLHVLTFATYGNKEPIMNMGSVVNMFNDAGFKTFWLDNNMNYNTGERGVPIMAAEAKYSKFRTEIQKNDGFGDMKLIPELKAALTDPILHKVIFLHLDGQHWPYTERYPSEFAKFSDKSSKWAEKVAWYDNGTLYLDHVLRSVIETLRGVDGVSVMLYFPDHGEDVIDEKSCFCHSTSIAASNMFEIPFILWRNKDFLRIRPLSIDTERKFNTQDFPFAAAHIAGIKGLEGTETRSPFAAGYVEPKVLYKK